MFGHGKPLKHLSLWSYVSIILIVKNLNTLEDLGHKLLWYTIPMTFPVIKFSVKWFSVKCFWKTYSPAMYRCQERSHSHTLTSDVSSHMSKTKSKILYSEWSKVSVCQRPDKTHPHGKIWVASEQFHCVTIWFMPLQCFSIDMTLMGVFILSSPHFSPWLCTPALTMSQH